MSKPKCLIIIPCYNEDSNISRIHKYISKNKILQKYEYHFCFIDDGSVDNTWIEINKLVKEFNFVHGLKLSKNFGKDSAIEAGLNLDDENYLFYIIIDADSQHPTEKIDDLIRLFEEEKLDIVNTHRIDNNEGFIRELFSKLFYFTLTKFSEIKIISKTTDFMLINKTVRDEFIKIREINKTFRIIINWMGYSKKSIPIEIKERYKGNSKFNFFSLTRLALNTLYSFSIFPIKAIGYLGIMMSIISIISLIIIILNFILKFTIVSWQTIIIFVLVLLCGLIMISVGLLGIYVYKILIYTNSRPNFIVAKKI